MNSRETRPPAMHADTEIETDTRNPLAKARGRAFRFRYRCSVVGSRRASSGMGSRGSRLSLSAVSVSPCRGQRSASTAVLRRPRRTLARTGVLHLPGSGISKAEHHGRAGAVGAPARSGLGVIGRGDVRGRHSALLTGSPCRRVDPEGRSDRTFVEAAHDIEPPSRACARVCIRARDVRLRSGTGRRREPTGVLVRASLGRPWPPLSRHLSATVNAPLSTEPDALHGAATEPARVHGHACRGSVARVARGVGPTRRTDAARTEKPSGTMRPSGSGTVKLP
jgi:hypothetical protein